MNVEEEKRAIQTDDQVKESSSYDQAPPPGATTYNANGAPVEEEEPNRPWWKACLEPGHAAQIVLAAAIAIAIGVGVTAAVGSDNVPPAVPVLLEIPGRLWLRCLQCVVIPMIVTAIILAVMSLREITAGGKILGRWTVSYYVLTTILAVAFSVVMTSQIWAPLIPTATLDEAKGEEIQEEQEENTNRAPHDVVYTLFMTLIPDNFVKAFFNNDLLAILISSIVVGYLIKPGNSSILRVVKEVNEMIVRVIAFVIKLAPIGVFFLILANMFKLDVKEMGTNLGLLIGGSVSSMMIHLFIILPLLYFAFVRKNPYPVFFKSSKAWITAWGTASSAATLPVTLRVCRERGNPNTIVDFAVPLGCMINMDGTSIYFPMVVVFMAETQGISLNAGEYILLILLSTLSAIGTTPIPSSSLVLTIMICSSIGIPLTEMYAVVVAIDWFIDRFRTMVNVSGDIYAAGILTKVTGIRDPEVLTDNEIGQVHSNTVRDNVDRV